MDLPQAWSGHSASLLLPRGSSTLVSVWCIWVLLSMPLCNSSPVIVNYRPVQVSSINNGKYVVPSGQESSLMLFGMELTNSTVVKFSEDATTCNPSDVNLLSGGNVLVEASSNNLSTSKLIQIGFVSIDLSVSSSKTYYFCVYEEDISDPTDPAHQGSVPWLAVVVQSSILPLWAQIIFIVLLMVLSGLFSGLNLGLMALDPTTLKIIAESGSKRQRIYAKLIYRVRKHGNYLLCTLLLGNVLVNSSLTVLLDSVLPGGIYAIIASTLTIVMFGEIIPQAICSRHGLVVGAWTIPLTFFFMIITFPISFPLSVILNLVLGKEIGAVYNRDQLLQLLSVTKEHHDLENDEVDIISGVLAYKKKTAEDVMTKFDDIFCINIDRVLDFKTMKEIYESGFSRIPVYEESKACIIHLLYVRDLAFVDPDDKTPLTSHVQFYLHDLLFFFEDTPLDEILKGFLEGKCHLGVIQNIVYEPDKDPAYVTVGVVTLEDIVEEILQREIVDETDRFIDNRTFKPRQARMVDVSAFVDYTNTLSSQQRLAVFQFLSTEVEPFKEEYISGVVLKRLLTQQIIVQTLSHNDYKGHDSTFYSRGSPTKFFCLILEGCMEVKIGDDDLIFESRSFSHFGAQALLNTLQDPPPAYRPDFSAWPVTDCLVVIITQQQYLAVHKASTFEKRRFSFESKGGGRGGGEGEGGGMSTLEPNDVFSHEWAKAETSDSLEASISKGPGGLGPISKFLSRNSLRSNHKKLSKDMKSVDQVQLLSSNDSSLPSSPVEVPSEPILHYDTSPGGMEHRRSWPKTFRTSNESGNNGTEHQSTQL